MISVEAFNSTDTERQKGRIRQRTLCLPYSNSMRLQVLLYCRSEEYKWDGRVLVVLCLGIGESGVASKGGNTQCRKCKCAATRGAGVERHQIRHHQSLLLLVISARTHERPLLLHASSFTLQPRWDICRMKTFTGHRRRRPWPYVITAVRVHRKGASPDFIYCTSNNINPSCPHLP